MAQRCGVVECARPDRERWVKRTIQFEAVKQTAEFFGLRNLRFTMLADNMEAADNLPADVKRLHVLRHGEAYHNVWRSAAFKMGRRPHAKRANQDQVPPELHDPKLTERGLNEAKEARNRAVGFRPQLLVTSPLRRAVQSMLVAFEDAVTAGVPVVAHELCREQFLGLDPSIYDSRKSSDELALEFPNVDFRSFVLPSQQREGEVVEGGEDHEVGAGEDMIGDPLWWTCSSPYGECEGGWNEAVHVQHAWEFVCWLMGRDEKEIAIASHSIFLLALFHGVLCPEEGERHAKRFLFHTGEIRSILIRVERIVPMEAPLLPPSSSSAMVEEPLQLDDTLPSAQHAAVEPVPS